VAITDEFGQLVFRGTTDNNLVLHREIGKPACVQLTATEGIEVYGEHDVRQLVLNVERATEERLATHEDVIYLTVSGERDLVGTPAETIRQRGRAATSALTAAQDALRSAVGVQ
jgi:hypothetical protein